MMPDLFNALLYFVWQMQATMEAGEDFDEAVLHKLILSIHNDPQLQLDDPDVNRIIMFITQQVSNRKTVPLSAAPGDMLVGGSSCILLVLLLATHLSVCFLACLCLASKLGHRAVYSICEMADARLCFGLQLNLQVEDVRNFLITHAIPVPYTLKRGAQRAQIVGTVTARKAELL